MSLQTTNRAAARRLATQVNLLLDDVAMLADGTDQLSRSQIETMLHAVVERHLGRLERVAAVAKGDPDFDPRQARLEDKRAFWTYALLDAHGPYAVVRPEDRVDMAADGLSAADVEAVQDHLAMLRINELVPTKDRILRQLVEQVDGQPTPMNIRLDQLPVRLSLRQGHRQ